MTCCKHCYKKGEKVVCDLCFKSINIRDVYICKICGKITPSHIKSKNRNKTICRNCDMMVFKDR